MRTVHCSVVRPVFAALLALVASPVLAQTAEGPPTRAGLMEQARETLASDITAPQRSAVERGLYWYDNQYLLAKVFAGWKGIRVGGGDFPAGAGMKFGVAYDKPLTQADPDPTTPNQIAFAARGACSTRGYARVRGGVDARNLSGRSIDVNGFGQFYEFPQEDYFGIGIDSSESNRTNYLLDAIETGGAVHWRPYRLDFGGGASYFSPRVGSGTDSRFASTEEVFTPATTPGLGTETDFIKVEASAAFDWRDTVTLPPVAQYPNRGGRGHTRWHDWASLRMLVE